MIQRFSNRVVNAFLIILAAISLIGAVTQLGVIQNTLSVKKNIVYTLLILICIGMYIFKKQLGNMIDGCVKSHRVYLTIFVLSWIVLIFYQINMIQALTGSMDLDPAFIYKLILHKPTVYNFYFSYYPNLLFLLNIENAIYFILGKPTIYVYLYFLNYINMLLIDLGILLIYLTVKKQINKKYAFFTFLVSVVIYGVTPYIAIPYSDNWAFCFCALYIFLLSTMYTHQKWDFNKPYVVILLGVVSALLFKIKPSTAITLIATIIIFSIIVISAIRKFNVTAMKKSFRLLLLFILPFMLTFGTCNYFASNNGLVKINKKLSASPLHFMAMGLHGDGQYWEEFNHKDSSLPPKARKKYEISTIKKDIKDFKTLSNFGDFIIKKQQHNSSLASWQRNTGPVSWNLVPKLKLHNQFQRMLRDLFTKNDYFFWNGYLIFVQFTWILVIILMILSYSEAGYLVQIIKYTVVGGFLFLILFEGGVSRYMIQYLPFIIVLAPYGVRVFFKQNA